MAQYTQRAAELAPNVDTKIGYLYESGGYFIQEYIESRNTKFLRLAERTLDKIQSLAPLSNKEKENINTIENTRRYLKNQLIILFPPK